MALVHAETSKPGIAPSNAFVLVEWSSLIVQEITGTAHWDVWGLNTIQKSAQVLEICLGQYSRPNIRHSALVVTRRGLRKAFSNNDTRQKTIEEIVNVLTSKATQPSAQNALLLGVVAGVCARKEEAKHILNLKKSEYFTFYTREIIGSKTHVPSHVANGLEDFFVAFTTKDDLARDVIPALEKALLRAPEIVLNDLVTPLFNALPSTIDLSQLLLGNLLKPLLANVKSSNAVIRQGAVSAFKAAIAKSSEVLTIAQIGDEIITPLKAGKLASPDQRAIHADMISILPVSNTIATKLSPALAAIAVKEQNEMALTSITMALIRLSIWSAYNEVELDKSVVEAFTKGISDKKVPAKRLWTTRLAELFWDVEDSSIWDSRLSSLAEAAIGPLISIWQETLINPITAAQTGIIGATYAFTALSNSRLPLSNSAKVSTALKKAQVTQQALIVEPKPSFLLNPRIYGKLTSDDEFKWFVRALSLLSGNISKLEPSSSVALAWSQAVIFTICSASISPETRNIAIQTLSKVYVAHPAQISRILVAGIWQWRNSMAVGEKDGAAAASKTNSQNLHLVVKAICLPPSDRLHNGAPVNQSIREEQLVELLILSRHELLPRVSWIDLCLRMDIDPGTLAKEHQQSLFHSIVQRTEFSENVRIGHEQG